MIRIAFLAFAEAHQFLHWIPAALALAARPDVEVTVLGASEAGLSLVRRFDLHGALRIEHLPTPSHRRDGLFSPPPRGLAALLHSRRLARFDAIVTSETSSSVLKLLPWFRTLMIHIKHGAGDALVGFNSKHRRFDLTLVAGEKHRRQLLAKRLRRPDQVAVGGYAKFEAIGPPERMFPDAKPVALYNPHAKAPESSWFGHGPQIVAAMERIGNWNFIVAPHVKLKRGPIVASASPNILIDRGSMRSIDMSYTQMADVYIGDASSQVYEFIARPRPCIFLNLDRIEWRAREEYSHWTLGQVIEDIHELGPALDRAAALQPGFEATQRDAFERSIERSTTPASHRQADRILEYLAVRKRR